MKSGSLSGTSLKAFTRQHSQSPGTVRPWQCQKWAVQAKATKTGSEPSPAGRCEAHTVRSELVRADKLEQEARRSPCGLHVRLSRTPADKEARGWSGAKQGQSSCADREEVRRLPGGGAGEGCLVNEGNVT